MFHNLWEQLTNSLILNYQAKEGKYRYYDFDTHFLLGYSLNQYLKVLKTQSIKSIPFPSVEPLNIL